MQQNGLMNSHFQACMTEWLNEKATASKHQQQQSTSTSTTTTAETTEDDDEDTTNNNATQELSTNTTTTTSSISTATTPGTQQDDEEEPTNFVRYVQSPRADPLQSHFRRRNSTPASATSGPGAYERMMSTPSTWCSTPGLPADNNAPSAAGSAKKV
jgi:Tfp pilus assembly major pilin PilA